MKNIVEMKKIVKKYGKTNVVDNLDLQVPTGSIFAFLGANGAGKTTTIRMLLNLSKNDEGSIDIFGKPLNGNEKEILKNIGSLVEGPAFYPNLSAYDNLKVFASVKNANLEEIPEILNKVNLYKVKDKAVKNYSLGMKQRLGIAIALLGNPDLLILDEPTNGLDPKGMYEVRELLLSLSREGKTIFISSHILGEIELIATDYAIIKNGKLVFSGDSQSLQNLSEKTIVIKTNDNVKALEVMKQEKIQCKLEGEFINIVGKDTDIAYINKLLVLQDFEVYHLSELKKSLEEIFLSLTSEVV